MRRAGYVGDEGGVARYRRSRRRMDRGQLALSLPSGRKAIVFARRGRIAIAALRVCYVLEGDCALNVFAGEHGRVLPLYEYPDIRRGHGKEDGRRGRRRVSRRLIWCACAAS
jgi:hypothetical protein